VLCGKGHERTIEMADGSIPWDEAKVARQELAGLGYGELEGIAVKVGKGVEVGEGVEVGNGEGVGGG